LFYIKFTCDIFVILSHFSEIIVKQDEENYVICVGHHYTQTNTNNVNKT